MDFVYDGKRTHGTDIKGGAIRIIYLGEKGGGLVLMNYSLDGFHGGGRRIDGLCVGVG